MVCAGRAVAHGRALGGRFSDPTALTLLPPDARARMQRLRAGEIPTTLRDRIHHGYLARQSALMVARTVAIDAALREAASPQVVLLGAGLDGRAYRMPELAAAIVFEVDHPDTQRDKRERVAALTQTACEVRFVAVDFAKDSLDAALDAAGHEPGLPTTWIWEGVVMYLTRAQIEATLAVVARRSASASRLVVLYHRPALMLALVGLVVRAVGEPLRSAFTPEEMKALLGAYHFDVTRDDDAPTIARALDPDLGRAVGPIKHMRLAVADRR
jgi:methyltransferase (TIGR00027 family)